MLDSYTVKRRAKKAIAIVEQLNGSDLDPHSRAILIGLIADRYESELLQFRAMESTLLELDRITAILRARVPL